MSNNHLDLEAVKERSWRRIYRNSIADDNWRASFDDANALISEVERLRADVDDLQGELDDIDAELRPSWEGDDPMPLRDLAQHLVADVERKDRALRAARDLNVSFWSPNDDSDSAGEMQFAILNSALSESPTETKGENR